MLYLIGLFCSPLALLLAGRPIQAMLNGLVWGASLVSLFIGLVFGILPALLLWGIGVAHAFAVINSRNADRRNDRLAAALRARR
jgi:4-hydroxybenzoate polyprenyltransferase